MKIIKNSSLLILVLISFIFSASLEIAVISKSKGNVTYKKENSTEWKKVRSGLMLESGTEIRTSKKSFAIIKYIDDKSIVKMRPKSELIISGEQESKNVLKKVMLNFGTAVFDISQKQKQFQIITPTSVASIKGTKFIVRTSNNGDNTTYFGLEGVVNICPKDKDLDAKTCMDLNKSFKAICTKKGIVLDKLSEKDLKEIIATLLDKINDDKDDTIIDIKILELDFISKDGRKKTVIIEYE